MRSKIDKNELVIQGKVIQAKFWPPKEGRTYTNGSATIRVGDTDIRLTIPLTVSKEKDESKAFDKTFKQGAIVLISKGQLSSWIKKGKDGNADEEVFQAEAKVSGSFVVEESEPYSNAVVSGLVVMAQGSWALIEASYFAGGEGGRTGELKQRRLKVCCNGRDLAPLLRKHITVIGTIGHNDRGPFVQAELLSVCAE